MESTSWHSYPKIYALGTGFIKELFFDDVLVEEKIDGSQFSFGVFNGVLKLKSKSKELIEDAPEKMFLKAVETVQTLKPLLADGYTYRAEFLQRPKHNVLAYDRVPNNNLILFDVNTGQERYMNREEKEAEAKRLNLEVVPVLYSGKVSSVQELESFLGLTSILGGQKIEGFVIKNYKRSGDDKKALMGKYVSESFKEKHKVGWKVGNPGQGDIVQMLVNKYRTPARWDKAIIHLREQGLLENTPRDIGKIIKEVLKDLIAECEAEIKEEIYNWVFDKLVRGVNSGLAQYYKEKLMESQFEVTDDGL